MTVESGRFFKNRVKETIEKRLHNAANARGRVLVISGPNPCRHYKTLKRPTNNHNNGITFVEIDKGEAEKIKAWKKRCHKNNRKVTVLHADIKDVNCEFYRFIDLDLMRTMDLMYTRIQKAFTEQMEEWGHIKTFMFTVCSRGTSPIVPQINELLSWIQASISGFDNQLLDYKHHKQGHKGHRHFPDIKRWGRLKHIEMYTYSEKIEGTKYTKAPMLTMMIEYK